MNLNEHLVARDMKKLEGEVRRMIKDFQKGNPYIKSARKIPPFGVAI